jgi:prepilin-type N-terminal cleavage/methylation domain-containing protein
MKSRAGFALIELLVGLVILAIVGLLAWRGLDSILRAKDVIENRMRSSAQIDQVVSQWVTDCEMLVRLENSAVSPALVHQNSLWLLRRTVKNRDVHWQIVRYQLINQQLERSVSRLFPIDTTSLDLWVGFSREMDSRIGSFQKTFQVDFVERQEFRLFFNSESTKKQLQGMQVEWWFKDTLLPLSKSCLSGIRI